jgi:hypothetical protein
MRELGVYIELSGNSRKSSHRSSLSNPQNNFLVLVSPTPPSGCQAQGVKVKIKYDMQYGKVNNNTKK